MSKVFSAARLRGSASFQRLTGVSVATFDHMLVQLSTPWNKVQARKPKSGRPWETGELEDHLLIMLIYYRWAGVNADIALILNLVILLGFMGFSHATLTLPGIAGVILTIGMGVDSNVLIFERIREEMRAGKAPSAAVD